MTCAEFKELVPALALGALEEAEREACEAHLATPQLHEGCLAEMARAEEASQLLALGLVPLAPGEAVWGGIERELATQVDAAVRRASALPSWSYFWRTVALAASVAVVFLLVGHGFGRREGEAALKGAEIRAADDRSLAAATRGQLEKQVDSCRHDLEAAESGLEAQQKALALLAEPATVVVSLAAQPNFSSRGSLIFNAGRHQAMVVARSLAPAPNRDYELWVIRGKEKIPAGLLKVDASGSAIARIDDSLLGQKVDLVAITLESAGGGAVPRGPLVLVARINKG